MTKDELATTIDKKLRSALVFKGKEDFDAYHQAEEYCKERGISVGRMCSPAPTGVKKGDYDIQKWKNLSFRDKCLMDGVIVGNFRNGPVSLYLSEEIEA